MAVLKIHPHYNSPQKNRFIGRVESDAKHNVAAAARLENMNPRTARDIFKKYKATGSTHRRPGSGRPPKLGPAAKRLVVREARKKRRAPLADIGNIVGASASVVRRELKAQGYRRCKAARVVFLTALQKQKRLSWARVQAERDRWDDIIWSDECYVIVDGSRNVVFVTRRPDEKYDEDCVVPVFKQSNIRVMVWGCVMRGRKGPLVLLDYPGGKGGGMTGPRYVKQVLQGPLKDFHADVQKNSPATVLFQQDGAPSHTAKLTKSWLARNNIPLFPHPPSSPDLSPIENVWKVLKTRLRARGRMPTSKKELEAAIREVWDGITTEDIDHFIDMMPDRVKSVINSKGGHTKY